jgi:hypothetical protein
VERHQSTSDKHDMLAVATVIGIGIVIAICGFWFWFDPLLQLGGMQMTFGLAVIAVIICQNVAISPRTAKIVTILPRTSKLLQSHRGLQQLSVSYRRLICSLRQESTIRFNICHPQVTATEGYIFLHVCDKKLTITVNSRQF